MPEDLRWEMRVSDLQQLRRMICGVVAPTIQIHGTHADFEHVGEARKSAAKEALAHLDEITHGDLTK
jgi:hypothetical protein